jgi:hypothetical protein
LRLLAIALVVAPACTDSAGGGATGDSTDGEGDDDAATTAADDEASSTDADAEAGSVGDDSGGPSDVSPCEGLVTDMAPHPMTALARPAYGESVVDAEFGTTITRISESPPGVVAKPMYSTVQAWNADESLLILYVVGVGHFLLEGEPPYALIGQLDIAPPDLEQVYWHHGEAHLFHYIEGNVVIAFDVRDGSKTPVHTIAACPGQVTADSHAFTAWDSSALGLACADNDTAFVLHFDPFSEGPAVALDGRAAPIVSASGALAYWDGGIYDDALAFQRSRGLAYAYEHSSNGMLPDGTDTYNVAAYDGAPVGSLVTYDMSDGTARVIVGPDSGWPYPPSGTHVSALAYRRPGWVAVSIVGDPAGQGVLDNELLVADTAPGGVVCRIAHHRSWGKGGAQGYWAEPHPVLSPSGTRVLFASDWGGGDSVDAFVLELPGYGSR